MTQRILISTGGSGGHVVPATILYEHLKDQFDVSVTTDIRGKKFLDSNYQMVVLRLNKNRELLESRPCENCQAVLDEIGIRKVWYSTKKGFETYLLSTVG